LIPQRKDLLVGLPQHFFDKAQIDKEQNVARSRNIKPSFFSNDELSDIEPLGRLLFIGLWTISDYKGELEWRPKRIKAQILPYDDCDIEKIAINLDKSGFIRFYSVQGKTYINIPTFSKHQNPHKNEREKGSEIPEYETGTLETIDLEPSEKNRDKSRLKRNNSASDRADSLNLIPDSLNLIPSGQDSVKKHESRSVCPHEQIIELWSEILPSNPQPRTWGEDRKKLLRTRWRESKDRQNLDWWRGFFNYISQSDFLTGKKTDFTADLPWCLQSSKFAKIIDGNYENKTEGVF
jgi:hypothetical protein